VEVLLRKALQQTKKKIDLQYSRTSSERSSTRSF